MSYANKIHLVFGRRSLIKFFERLTGSKSFQILPHGVDFLDDLIKLKLDENFNVIFDVGANCGQSALRFRKKFPNSDIFSFEPFEETYHILKKNTNSKNILCYKIAFGKELKKINGFLDKNNPTSLNNSLLEQNIDSNFIKSEEINLCTIDDFCNKNYIDHIDYLKRDTEGYDLEVLKGAKKTISEKTVKFIETEVTFNNINKKHIHFQKIYEFLLDYNYQLFGIYDQQNEASWTGDFLLRRSNVVFISNEAWNKKI